MKSITPISASAGASLRLAFEKRYGSEPRLFSAPGRVNLIGEHTDYNDGFVLPLAIQQRTLIAAAARSDRTLRVYSNDFGEERTLQLDAPRQTGQRLWLDYVEGVARILGQHGIQVPGADLMITSEVPQGAGLSSSAALEIAVGLALSSLAGKAAAGDLLARVGQEAEHEYAGVKCGIMDQMVSANARSAHVLLIDCKDLQIQHVPLPLDEHTLLLCDSKVRHSHTDSGYNERRQECESAVELIRSKPPITSLREVNVAALDALEKDLPERIFRRARHVVTENQRVLDAVAALGVGDLPRLGQLMSSSHHSLRDDYEVSCPELDQLVELANSHSAVLGARMTGGGFGGAVIALVRDTELVSVSERVATGFKERFGHTPELRVVSPSDGMREAGA